MNTIYEIHRCINGYIMTPARNWLREGMPFDSEIYVFNDYAKAVDKLFELLNSKLDPDQ